MSPETDSSDRRRRAPCDGLTATREPAAPREHGPAGEVIVEVHRDAVPSVVVVTGRLGREGGALLAAMLAHVRRQGGPPVVLDLRQVSYADRLGLAPVLDAGPVIGRSSPEVDRELSRWAAHWRWPAGARDPVLRRRTGPRSPSARSDSVRWPPGPSPERG
jgi:hypothetical protein